MNWAVVTVTAATSFVVWVLVGALLDRLDVRHDQCACGRRGQFIHTRHTGQIVWRCKRCDKNAEQKEADL